MGFSIFPFPPQPNIVWETSNHVDLSFNFEFPLSKTSQIVDANDEHIYSRCEHAMHSMYLYKRPLVYTLNYKKCSHQKTFWTNSCDPDIFETTWIYSVETKCIVCIELICSSIYQIFIAWHAISNHLCRAALDAQVRRAHPLHKRNADRHFPILWTIQLAGAELLFWHCSCKFW